MNASPYGLVVSASGQHVVYLDNMNYSGNGSADVVVVQPDGTGRTTLAPSIAIEMPAAFVFAGETVVTAVAPAYPLDGGIPVYGPLEAFTPPSWTASTLAPQVFPGGVYTTNAAGTLVLAAAAGGLTVVSVPGAAATLVDPNGAEGTFTSDGAGVVYTTQSGALERFALGPSTVTELAASGFPALLSLSPDGNWAVGTVQSPPTNPATQQISTDLYFASASSPGSVQTLSTTANVSPSPSFTADSSHLVFVSDTSSLDTSTLHVVPASGSGTAFPGVWSFDIAGGGHIVFNDDYRSIGGVGANGTADIEWLDTMQSAAPTLLVSQADATFFLTADQKTLVYSWSYQSGQPAGVWALALP
jgi:hypothetical protein